MNDKQSIQGIKWRGGGGTKGLQENKRKRLKGLSMFLCLYKKKVCMCLLGQ